MPEQTEEIATEHEQAENDVEGYEEKEDEHEEEDLDFLDESSDEETDDLIPNDDTKVLQECCSESAAVRTLFDEQDNAASQELASCKIEIKQEPDDAEETSPQKWVVYRT